MPVIYSGHKTENLCSWITSFRAGMYTHSVYLFLDTNWNSSAVLQSPPGKV